MWAWTFANQLLGRQPSANNGPALQLTPMSVSGSWCMLAHAYRRVRPSFEFRWRRPFRPPLCHLAEGKDLTGTERSPSRVVDTWWTVSVADSLSCGHGDRSIARGLQGAPDASVATSETPKDPAGAPSGNV
jgi:hypothetical protein